MKTTAVFSKNVQGLVDKQRLIINQGSTRSGKTFAVLQVFLLLASRHSGLIISVVAQTLPHLKRGAIRDFKTIVLNAGLNFDKYYNRSNYIFEYNGSIIEFFSVDNSEKVRGAGRDYLFINEANDVKFETYQQLAQRTRKSIFIDYNPTRQFWAITELMNKRSDYSFIHSTYKDNIFLDAEIVKEIEANKIYPNYWRVYGLGLVGYSEDLLFQADNLRRYENINIKDASNIIAFIDTADKGKDYYCMVIGATFNKDIYIIDVIYNQKTLGINEITTIEKLRAYNVDFCVVETNKEGSYFIGNLKKQTATKMIPLFNTANKESRILSRADYINDRFLFKKNIPENSAYKKYFADLSSYSQTEKNEHDDGPDATAGLAKFATNYLKMF